MLAASRRTPVAFREAIRARYANRDALLWLDDTDGTNAYAGMLAWADRIVCSPDSVNMISEACGTYVPVFVANAVGIRGRIRAFIDDLVAAGRVRPLEAGLAPFKVEPLRETERIARELKERL
jgi:mitochondrial fission protein ELM1